MDNKKNVLEELHNVAQLIQEASDLVNTLKKQRTELINNGRNVGVPLTDMATILDISRQRLYQLIDEDSKQKSLYCQRLYYQKGNKMNNKTFCSSNDNRRINE